MPVSNINHLSQNETAILFVFYTQMPSTYTHRLTGEWKVGDRRLLRLAPPVRRRRTDALGEGALVTAVCYDLKGSHGYSYLPITFVRRAVPIEAKSRPDGGMTLAPARLVRP